MGLWWITPTVYLGDKQGAADVGKLVAAGITHVVNLAGSKSDNLAPPPMVYANIRLLDKDDAVLPIQEVLDFAGVATRKGGRVLFHCRGGLSRSPALVAAHLMANEDVALADAVGLIERGRGKQFINQGFMRQLHELEESLGNKATSADSDTASGNAGDEDDEGDNADKGHQGHDG